MGKLILRFKKKKKFNDFLCFLISQNKLVSKWEQEENKTSSSPPIPSLKGYTFYVVGPQHLAKPQIFQYTKKISNLILGQIRMKISLNYPKIRHALELIDFCCHFQKPLVIVNFTRTWNHKFQLFQSQKKPTTQVVLFVPLTLSDLEAADTEEGMSWWSCSPQKEDLCSCEVCQQPRQGFNKIPFWNWQNFVEPEASLERHFWQGEW